MSCALDLNKQSDDGMPIIVSGVRYLTACEKRRAMIIDFDMERSLIAAQRRDEDRHRLACEAKVLESQIEEMESTFCHPEALVWLRHALLNIRTEFEQTREYTVC